MCAWTRVGGIVDFYCGLRALIEGEKGWGFMMGGINVEWEERCTRLGAVCTLGDGSLRVLTMLWSPFTGAV